ncbi:hypothetical protein [Oceanicaulis sp. MMSF_3324]|uniref:hypothetical protein n=1 Tax=Oceanicaulis sp. MMSF_3324 TaxID=3046702 RepID=UPI00273E1DB1|nr:hypothetical protein [Oceanicaulis sp. MMSF_3324]
MKPSKSKTVWMPEPRILTLIGMIALVMGLVFSALLTSWVYGAAVGLVFAGGIYLFVVVNARRAAKTLTQNHHGKHRGRI